ncbi:MAG TPA: hypothetical protein VD837_14385 [Terriglobales bacterium]|nr:hypothetical protein [Terriglobales bacterium]
MTRPKGKNQIDLDPAPYCPDCAESPGACTEDEHHNCNDCNKPLCILHNVVTYYEGNCTVCADCCAEYLVAALELALETYTEGDYEFDEGVMTEVQAKELIPLVAERVRQYPNLVNDYGTERDETHRGDQLIGIIEALWLDKFVDGAVQSEESAVSVMESFAMPGKSQPSYAVPDRLTVHVSDEAKAHINNLGLDEAFNSHTYILTSPDGSIKQAEFLKWHGAHALFYVPADDMTVALWYTDLPSVEISVHRVDTKTGSGKTMQL